MNNVRLSDYTCATWEFGISAVQGSIPSNDPTHLDVDGDVSFQGAVRLNDVQPRQDRPFVIRGATPVHLTIFLRQDKGVCVPPILLKNGDK